MKKILCIITVLLTFLIQANCQHLTAIHRIDSMEQSIINQHGREWLINFYNIWEINKNDSRYQNFMINNECGKNLKSLLENDLNAFIIHGWLYVFSYKLSILINESYDNYKNAYVFYRNDKNDVWLYRKNIITNSQWEIANNNPVFKNILNENENGDGFSYYPVKGNKKNNNQIIKSVAYENVVFILCHLKTNNKCTNQLIVLSPDIIYPNGSIYYNFGNNPSTRHLNTYYYPIKFTGQINGGKTLTTISNTGKNENINIYLNKDSYGRKISGTRVSFDGGGYGFLFCDVAN